MRELAPCCICKRSDRKVLYPATTDHLPKPGDLNPYSGHYQINECAGCGLIYSSPILDEGAVKLLYTSYSESNVADTEIAGVSRTMLGYYRLMQPFLAARDRILDIGCDIGLLLEVAAADGFTELHGLEPVAVAREQLKARLPAAEVSSDFYEEAIFPPESFDAVTLVHVLDHLARPETHLHRIREHLKPGGVVLAVVHNVKSPLARLMGERFPVFNFFHHYFFSKRTLANLFITHGFRPLRVVSTQNVYSLAFFLERTPFLAVTSRRALANLARRARIGHVQLSLPVGNIAIVARKDTA